jgi:hypothetical protein
MKTCFCYSDFEDLPTFFVLDGDYRHLNGTLINATAPEGTPEETYEKRQEELSDLLYDDEGNYLVAALTEPPKDYDHFVKVGFVL